VDLDGCLGLKKGGQPAIPGTTGAFSRGSSRYREVNKGRHYRSQKRLTAKNGSRVKLRAFFTQGAFIPASEEAEALCLKKLENFECGRFSCQKGCQGTDSRKVQNNSGRNGVAGLIVVWGRKGTQPPILRADSLDVGG